MMISRWRLNLGIFGTLLWLTLFFNLEQITFVTSTMGYLLGFISSYGFYLFLKKPWQNIINDTQNIYSKLLAIAMLTFILMGALLGYAAKAYFKGFDWASWSFLIPFLIAGLVVKQGLFPVINYMESRESS